MAPKNVANPKLYDSIHNAIKAKLARQNRRWGAYASGQLVQEYKRRGGKYIGKKTSKKGLNRWFSEKWINVCKLPRKVACGRSDANKMGYSELKKKYPYCRPSKKITGKTPTTSSGISKATINRLCSAKKKDPRKTMRRV